MNLQFLQCWNEGGVGQRWLGACINVQADDSRVCKWRCSSTGRAWSVLLGSVRKITASTTQQKGAWTSDGVDSAS